MLRVLLYQCILMTFVVSGCSLSINSPSKSSKILGDWIKEPEVLFSTVKIPVEPATQLSWIETSPTSQITITANWTPSVSTHVKSQKIELFSDKRCQELLSPAVELLSVSTHTFSLNTAAAQQYSYRIISIGQGGELGISNCSDPMIVTHVLPNIPIALHCDLNPEAESLENVCTLTPANPVHPVREAVTYVDAESSCADVVVNSVSGSVTFTAPIKDGTCVIKLKAFDGTFYSDAVVSKTIKGS